MKIKLIFFYLIFFSSFSQTTNVSLTKVANEYEIKLIYSDSELLEAFISDKKNGDIAAKINVDQNASASTFTSNILKKIKSVTKTYQVKIANTDISFPVAKEKLNDSPTYKNELEKLDEEKFISLVKRKTVYNNSEPKQTYDEFTKSINTGNSKSIFTGCDSYKLLKDENKKIYIENGTFNIIVENEESFFNKFFETFNTKKDELIDCIIKPTELYINESDIVFPEKEIKKLEEIFASSLKKNDFKLVRTVTATSQTDNNDIKNYEVSIKFNAGDTYVLKFCDDNYLCEATTKFKLTEDKTTFKAKINSFITTKLSETRTISELDLELLYNDCRVESEKTKIKEAIKPFQDTITSILEKIENLETQYSGIVKLNKIIRTYEIVDDPYTLFGFQKSSKKLKEDKSEKFVIKDAHLRFFNNKLKDVVIVGYLENNPDLEFRVLNINYSIPIRSFNNSKQYLPISPNDDDAKKLYININDVFDYDKSDSYNYSVRNKEYNLKAGESVKIEERKLMDYFTAVIFSDFLGLNNNSTNALLQAEGRIKIPIWISNFRTFSIFNALNADVNATIYNGFDDSSRFIEPLEVVDEDGSPSFIINNFDYIKNNNVNAGINLGLFNWEWKGLYTEFNFGYGLRYFRSGLRHTIVNDGVDNVKTYQLNALSHELIANFEIRPQLNFGADLNFAFNWLNARGATDDVPIILNQDNNNDDKSVLRVQLNLYSKLNPDKTNDGIYARLGGFYHLGAKDFFPQILVGYATNLSTFVNKFKK
jgi:hypothetical protein